MKETPYLEGKDDLIQKVKSLQIFAILSDEELKSLFRISKIRTYSPDEIIIEENTCENMAYFLISGKVKIEKSGKKLAELFSPGDVFGELSFIDGSPRSASVIVVKDVVCLAIDAAYLYKIKETEKNSYFYGEIYKMFAKILTHRLRITTNNYIAAKKELEKVLTINKIVYNK